MPGWTESRLPPSTPRAKLPTTGFLLGTRLPACPKPRPFEGLDAGPVYLCPKSFGVSRGTLTKIPDPAGPPDPSTRMRRIPCPWPTRPAALSGQLWWRRPLPPKNRNRPVPTTGQSRAYAPFQRSRSGSPHPPGQAETGRTPPGFFQDSRFPAPPRPTKLRPVLQHRRHPNFTKKPGRRWHSTGLL